jgi:hypothetical protein
MKEIFQQTKKLILLVIFLIALVFLIFITQVVPVKGDYFQSWYNFINCIAPIITVVLVYKAFDNQQGQLDALMLQIKRTDENNLRNLIENRFFLFLKIHRDNVAAMTFNHEVVGKKLFVRIITRFKIVFKKVDIVLTEMLKDGLLKRALTLEDKIEISYDVIFYGCSGLNSEAILRKTLRHYDQELVKKTNSFPKQIIDRLKIKGIKENGMQSNLSNYYRHLFHTVTYIHDLETLSEKDKKFYIKRLRGQLTNYEMALLYLNSFSIGYRWKHYDPENEESDNGVNLISEYELIKNLPEGFFSEFEVDRFFPNMRYERRRNRSETINSPVIANEKQNLFPNPAQL